MQGLDPAEGSVQLPARPWSTGRVFLLGWLRPGSRAGGTAGMSLLRAWVIHLEAGLLAVPAIALLVACGEVNRLTLGAVFRRFTDSVGDGISELSRDPIEATVAIVGVSLLIQAGFLVAAAAVMPWGARVERLRDSYQHALRQMWLHTVHFLVIILLVGAFAVALSRANTAWKAAHPFTMPTVPAGGNFGDIYRAAHRDYLRQQPLHVRFCIHLAFYAGTAALGWSVWALLRAVGAPRYTPQLTRPPTCEACGYNLSATPADARCPECGRPVSESLDPTKRPGGPWERRRELGTAQAYLESALAPLFRPGQLGREIRLFAPGLGHRAFLAFNLALIFVIAAAAMPLGATAAGETRVLHDEEFWVFPPVIAGLGCVTVVCFTTLAAALVGVFILATERQNVLPAAMQVAGYLSFYMALWTLFAGGVAGLLAAHHQVIFNLLGTRNSPETLVAIWAALMLVALGGYLWLLWKGTLAARFANR